MRTFYLIELKDENGAILPYVVQNNTLYNSLEQVNRDVNMAFSIPTTIIAVY